MNLSRIYLSAPHMGGTEEKFVQEAFSTNWIAPLGPNVDGFEKDISEFTGTKHAVALSSGTAALHLALIMLDVQPGDVVICQSMTFSASANPIAYQGAIPVFVDSEKDTWNMCPIELEKAIKASIDGELKKGEEKIKSQKPKAIIPVHLYGMPAKMDKLSAIAAKYDIPIVEDAAESLGSTLKGRQTGTFGKMSILSFNGNKIITTSGGGALISDEEALTQKARFLATQARDPAPHYQHSQIGYNYRMSNIVAGIGRGQMEVLNERIRQRRQVFAWYKAYFEGIKTKGYHIGFQPELGGNFSNRWLTAIFVDPDKNKGINREQIRFALEKDNIESRPLWKPMHQQPVFENYPHFGKVVSDELFEKGLCLPSGSNLTGKDLNRIQKALNTVFN